MGKEVANVHNTKPITTVEATALTAPTVYKTMMD